MQILTDAVLALLAAVGIWTLGRMLWDWLWERGGMEPEVWTVVRAQGDGSGLEQAVGKLRRRGGDVVLMDCGLNEQGRELANRLTQSQSGVRLCRMERL